MLPKISIVVPVYKSEQYIAECLESILLQSFRDFECIVVDDGSPDCSGEICEIFRQKDDRIRVVHQPNLGVSAARQLGVEKAVGEYILFVDSDDTLPVNALQILEEYATDYDFIISSEKEKVIKDKIEVVALFMESRLPRALWGKLIKKDLLDFCTFPPASIKIGEDYLMNLQLAQKAKKIKIVSPLVYNYRRHAESITFTFRRTLEYEKLFYRELETILTRTEQKEKIKIFLLHHRFNALKAIIQKKGKVDFNDSFVLDMIRDSRKFSLTFEEKMILCLKDSLFCTYFIKAYDRWKRFFNK